MVDIIKNSMNLNIDVCRGYISLRAFDRFNKDRQADILNRINNLSTKEISEND
jgi:hypothetical protein